MENEKYEDCNNVTLIEALQKEHENLKKYLEMYEDLLSQLSDETRSFKHMHFCVANQIASNPELEDHEHKAAVKKYVESIRGYGEVDVYGEVMNLQVNRALLGMNPLPWSLETTGNLNKPWQD